MPAAVLAPDLILLNARIHTVDPRDTGATAVAIADGRFVAVGGNDEVRGLAGSTRVVSGLIDAHYELISSCMTFPISGQGERSVVDIGRRA